MDAHRSRSLGTAALIFILISLTAAVFHGAAPVRAEDAATPAPIVIDGDTAEVKVELFTDEGRKTPLGDNAVLSTDTLYGSFSARFEGNRGPSAERNVAEYSLPDSIKAFENTSGRLTDDSNQEAGSWRCENNKLIFTFDEAWIKLNPSDIHVAADFSFKLSNQDVGSGNTTKIEFPGTAGIDVMTKDGDVTGTKEGKFFQDANGASKVTWTVKLKVESCATNIKLSDTLGDNFEFVEDSFTLDGKKLDPQPTIANQTATLDSLDKLSVGEHEITYETLLKSGVSVENGNYINEQDASKNTVTWDWTGASSDVEHKAEAWPEKFRYDMIQKTSKGSPSDITWTVTLNQGELKADMSGYKFTDKLDDKQVYTGSYTVYKGTSESDGAKIGEGALDSSKDSFSYTFRDDLDDKYATYCIVYHTRMNDTNSYDTVHNDATIEHEGRVSGTAEGKFTPQLVGALIAKRLVSDEEASTTGNAAWETTVALKTIVDAIHPKAVRVNDTFQTAWSQNIGVDSNSMTIKIGDTVLQRGVDWCFTQDSDSMAYGTKKNFNLDINITENVKKALEKDGNATIVYKTNSDALPGWYSNFASVDVNGVGSQRKYTEAVVYVVNREATPSVEKPENEAIVSWDGDFDWNAVDGTSEKGAWIVDWTVYANRVKTPGGDCYGAGKLNEQPLMIVDKLPDGMTYVPGSATYSLFQNPYEKHSGYYGGDKSETVADGVKLGDDGVKCGGDTVTFTVPTGALGSYAGYAKLVYRTAVKRGALDTSKNETKLTNSAHAESGDKKFEAGSGTVTIKNNVLEKTGEQVANSNRIKYTIRVNESAVDLKSDSDYLELVDIMDAKCTLVTDKVKVYQYDGADWSLLGSDKYTTSAETVRDGNGAACTKMTLRVPDEKYLKVEYEVIPAGNAGDTVSLSNKASLTGVFDGNAKHEKNWEIQRVSGSAVGNGYGVTVTKVDESDIAKKLSGATFTLYEVNMDRALNDGVDAVKTVFEKDAPTGDNGTVIFGTADHRMKAYTLYCLEETHAPEGYNVIDKPVWIMLKGNNEEDYQKALAKAEELRAKGADIDSPTPSTNITVYDAPYSGQATISATKLLQGSTLQKGQFSFELKDDKGRVLQTVTNGADGSISFSVEYNKVGTYTYTISEVVPKDAENNVKDHITYDAIKHKVKVVVANGDGKLDVTVTYDNDSPTPPTFTNKYSTTLPEAGGAGLTMTYLAGASLLCFAATWMHARRHRGLDRGGRNG